jgi:Contractile injection system tube protein/LysM domain
VVSVTPTGAPVRRAVACLRIIRPADDPNPIIPLCFNPTEYQVSKANMFAEIPVPGLETPLLQYIRGDSEKLSLEALVDTSDTLLDVRVTYVEKLRRLMSINPQEHAPPLVAFVWDRPVHIGVLESLSVSYVLFTPEGIPLRAKLTMSLREYRSAATQEAQTPKQSPNVEKSFVVRRGDTLASISQALYRSPAYWRELATANGITDPRRLQPGQVLTAPRLSQ